MRNIKLFAMFIAGLSVTALATYAAPVAIEAAINSFTLYMNRILVTTTGGPDGQTIVDINNMDSSAALLVNSTTRGFLPPRLTTAQRNAINNPAKGLIIFNTDLGFHEAYNGPSGNQAEYWQSIGTTCPSVSILQVENTNLNTTLNFGAGFEAVGNANERSLETFAEIPPLGETTIQGLPFSIQGALIVDTNNNRILSAAEKSLFDDSILYGTIYMRPSGLIPLAGNNAVTIQKVGRSVLGGVVTDSDSMLLYMCGELIPGCIQSDATNYDPQANIDDGSCTMPEVETQIDMYFSSGSSAVYSTSTGSSIIFSGSVSNGMCADAANDFATVTATWTTTNGSTPTYSNSSYPYGSANVGGNTATWTIDPMYIGCGEIPLSVTLYNIGSGQVTVDWTVSINNDANLGNNSMSQYGTWTAQQGGGGANYDYSIYSGNGASFNTTVGSTLTPSIVIGGDAYNGCLAGYGIQVSASLPTAISSYSGSNGGLMGIPGSYNGMTVTWTYTGTDSMQCSYLASNATYSIQLNGMTSGNDTVSWNIGPALPGSNDGNSMNNYTTQYVSRTAGGGSQTGSSTDIYITSMGGSSGTAGSTLTSNAYVYNSCSGSAENVTVTASWNTYSGAATYASSYNTYSYTGGVYDSMMNSVSRNLGNIGSCANITFNMSLYSATPELADVYRSVSSSNDSNNTNNSAYNSLSWSAAQQQSSGVDLQVSTPMSPGSMPLGSSMTGSIYMSELSGNNANNIVITATVPTGYPYATLVGTNADAYSGDGMMDPIVATRYVGTAYTGGPFTIMLNNNTTGGTIYTNRSISTSDNDINPSNNSYSMPFTRY